jgi:hypothetical protein
MMGQKLELRGGALFLPEDTQRSPGLAWMVGERTNLWVVGDRSQCWLAVDGPAPWAGVQKCKLDLERIAREMNSDYANVQRRAVVRARHPDHDDQGPCPARGPRSRPTTTRPAAREGPITTKLPVPRKIWRRERTAEPPQPCAGPGTGRPLEVSGERARSAAGRFCFTQFGLTRSTFCIPRAASKFSTERLSVMGGEGRVVKWLWT